MSEVQSSEHSQDFADLEGSETRGGIDERAELAWEEAISNRKQLKSLSEEILQSAREINYPIGQAKALRNLAYYQFVYGQNNKESVAYAQEGLHCLRQTDHEKTRAELYDMLAMCFKRLGSFDLSLDYTQKSIDL